MKLPSDAKAIEQGCYLDETEPKQIKLFARKYCSIDLLDWQYEGVIKPLWGWRRRDKKLRFRTGHIWCPKKSGKSFLLALIAAWKVTGKTKTKTIILSGVKEQTDEIWSAIEGFAAGNETLNKRLWFRKDKGTIVDRVSKSELKIISGKGDAKSGFNCDLLIIDEFFELHPAYAANTWAKVKHAGMARPNSLVLTISHANYNHTCPAYDCWVRSRNLLDGKEPEVNDITTFAIHYGVPEFADWKDESNWWPNLPACPELVPQEFYREEYAKVKDSPTDSVQFRTFHLNQIVGAPENWLAPGIIQACHEEFDESRFYGMPVVIGVDAAKSYDIYSYVTVCKVNDLYYVIPKFAIPEKKAEEWEKKHHVPYRAWANDPKSNLILTPGDTIDHLYLVERLKAETFKFQVLQLRYDPTNFQPSRQLLEGYGINCKEVTQSQRGMGPGFTMMDGLFRERKLRHNNNPIYLNHLDNCVPKLDRYDRLDIKKSQDINKIDSVDATAIALSYWLDKDTVSAVVPQGQSVVEIW